MESLTLARGALESMLAHARETHPEECCGAVLVEGGRDVVRRFTNIQGRLHREDPATQPRDARTTGEARAFRWDEVARDFVELTIELTPP